METGSRSEARTRARRKAYNHAVHCTWSVMPPSANGRRRHKYLRVSICSQVLFSQFRVPTACEWTMSDPKRCCCVSV